MKQPCDCGKRAVKRGMCEACYQRWRRRNPEAVRVIGDDRARFWQYVEPGDCWEWTATRTEAGYGRFYFREAIWKAPRVAWTLLIGEIPDGMEIDHLCFNPPCVNPDHLRVVGVSENRSNIRVNGGGLWRRNLTHCKWGHEFTEKNTYRAPGSPNHRRCRACKREREKGRYQE